MALKRPVELVMEKVALINKDGSFWRFFANLHDGFYANRVTAEGDLQVMTMTLRLTNFTKRMENIYCVKYDLRVKDDVSTCHSQALILRDIGECVLNCAARDAVVQQSLLNRKASQAAGFISWRGSS